MSSTSSCSLSESSRKAISLERLDDNDIFYILYEQTTQIAEIHGVSKHKSATFNEAMRFFSCSHTEKKLSRHAPRVSKQGVFFALTHTEIKLLSWLRYDCWSIIKTNTDFVKMATDCLEPAKNENRSK